MTNDNSDHLPLPKPHGPDAGLTMPSEDATELLARKRARNLCEVSHMFTVVPDVDNESILCHACENIASLNVMGTDLASELEGAQRHIALAIQQLAVLCELALNRALDNLEPPLVLA